MPGPPPTPTKLKLIRGNPGKRAINKREPVPAEGAPSCPTWLPAEAKAEWQLVTGELAALGMLYKIDRGLLAAWAAAWDQFYEATKLIRRDGYSVETRAGQLVQNPAVIMRAKATEIMLKIAAQFGLSPSARSRLEAPAEPEAVDPLQELIARA